VEGLRDLDRREWSILVIICAAIFWIGLFPNGFLQKTEQAAIEYQERMLRTTPRPAAPAARPMPAAVPAPMPPDSSTGEAAR
jgi:NADH:ubiquinone oxidoreductase subunit 4 (subunit M)